MLYRGCLPATNCLVDVPPNSYVAVERFGAFQRLLGPGLAFAGFDLFGRCVVLRKISNELEVQHLSSRFDAFYRSFGWAFG